MTWDLSKRPCRPYWVHIGRRRIGPLPPRRDTKRQDYRQGPILRVRAPVMRPLIAVRLTATPRPANVKLLERPRTTANRLHGQALIQRTE
jgi:hypothetical protein